MTITTDRDAKAQIIAAIESTGVASSDDYDIDRILRLTHVFEMPGGFRQTVPEVAFWQAVQESEKAPAEADAFS